MSIQDPPYGNPPDRPATQKSPFGEAATDLGQAVSNDAAKLREAGETVRSDLQSALETAKDDFRTVTDTAKRDFASLKDQALNQFQNLKGQAGEQAQSLKDQAAGQLQSLKEQATDQFQTLKSEAQGQLGEAAEKAKRYATEQVSHLTDQARSFATEQKDLAARQFSGVVDAVARVADELQGSDGSATVANYAQSFAGGLRDLADTVQNKSVDELIGMVQDFGRRQPLAFVGIAALAGFAASRFLLASRNRASDWQQGQEGRQYTAGRYASERFGDRPFSTDVELDRTSSEWDEDRSATGMSSDGRF